MYNIIHIRQTLQFYTPILFITRAMSK